MKYQYLSQQENQLISKMEKMIAKIRDEFADEIKYIEVCNWDLVQIYVSKDFLDSILEISKNENPDFNGWLDFFLRQEYFTHLNYILLIIARLFDDPRESKQKNIGVFSLKRIKNSIEGSESKNSIKELVDFLNIPDNIYEIQNIDQKMMYHTVNNMYLSNHFTDSFPNLLYLRHIQSSITVLRAKYKKVYEIYEKVEIDNIKLKDVRNNYLAHNLRNMSFAEMTTNFYLNDDFLDLLREIENLLDAFYSVLKDTRMSHNYVQTGYSVKDIFKKLENIILKEIEARKIK